MRGSFLPVILFAACAAASCGVVVKDRAYRSSSSTCGGQRALPCSVVSEYLHMSEFNPAGITDTNRETFETLLWPYRLAFIEFDDRGQMHDADQLPRALHAIEETKADARELGKPPVVALFVHGWKNNASESSGNVWGFRQTLAGLAAQYSHPTNFANGRVSVIGIYVGWRGATLKLPIVEEFTFWDRYAKSQSLATGPTSPMVEALAQIMKAANPEPQEQATQEPASDRRSSKQRASPPRTLQTRADADALAPISVLIGHSFGGAVLETAVTYRLNELIGDVKPGSHLAAPADLIMFLNEAQEALRSDPLLESMIAKLPAQDHCKAFDPPLILSISSTGDSATRAFFPFGQLVARPFHRLKTYPERNAFGFDNQRPMYYHTTAHLTAFQSHLIIATPIDNITTPISDASERAAYDACLHPLTTNLKDSTGVPSKYVMVKRPGSRNSTPYWVMQMPPSIVPDHSTIFTPVFRNFLISVLSETRPISPE